MDKLKINDLKYSIAGKRKSNGKEGSFLPGPGQYEVENTINLLRNKGIQPKIGSSKRELIGDQVQKIAVPGPGDHSPDTGQTRYKGPEYGFGTGEREPTNTSGSPGNSPGPGPGSYQLPKIMGDQGKKATIASKNRYKPDEKERSLKPGPANYSPNSLIIKRTIPKAIIGTE